MMTTLKECDWPEAAGNGLRRVIAVVIVLTVVVPVCAKKQPDFNLKWSDGHRVMDFQVRGRKHQYPADMLKNKFPPPGAPVDFKIESKWPLVTLRGRWTASTKGWPAEYRAHALDFILMRACDAEAYEQVYSKVFLKSKLTFPPEFLDEAKTPSKHRLVERMRGKQVGYEIKATAGPGAADYTIKTKITVGLSKDGKTVFYFDKPESISEHLLKRDIIFSAYDLGDKIHMEVRALCLTAPRIFFKGEMLRRVERDAKYLVMRMYETLSDAPTQKEIDKYLTMVKKKERTIKPPPATMPVRRSGVKEIEKLTTPDKAKAAKVNDKAVKDAGEKAAKEAADKMSKE